MYIGFDGHRYINRFYIRRFRFIEKQYCNIDYCIVRTRNGEEIKCYISDGFIIEINSHGREVVIGVL